MPEEQTPIEEIDDIKTELTTPITLEPISAIVPVCIRLDFHTDSFAKKTILSGVVIVSGKIIEGQLLTDTVGLSREQITIEQKAVVDALTRVFLRVNKQAVEEEAVRRKEAILDIERKKTETPIVEEPPIVIEPIIEEKP